MPQEHHRATMYAYNIYRVSAPTDLSRICKYEGSAEVSSVFVRFGVLGIKKVTEPHRQAETLQTTTPETQRRPPQH